MIYLDNHSSAFPCKAALQSMQYELAPGPVMSAALEGRQQPIYEIAGASFGEDRFVYTGSRAEAINQVFWSAYQEARKNGKTHILISAIEDAVTMQCAKRLEELGCTVKIIPVNELGQIDTVKLLELINPRTSLISVTMAHGLTGVIQPVEEITRIAKEKGVLLHLDATYALGKYLFSFDADYLTFAGDLIHSVKSGGLFAKKHVPLTPFILGGALDVPGFLALSAAAQQATFYLDTMALEVARLKNLLESGVKGTILYKNSMRLPNVTAIVFDGAHQEALLYLLQRKGLFASIGGTISAHLGTIHESAVSFSLSRMTTEEEIQKAIILINESVFMLQSISEGV